MVSELRAPERVLLAIRRISRAVDLHSRRLLASHRLTSPQLLLLREINSRGEVSLGRLANTVSLSNATITGIVDRLERDGLVARHRSEADRRVIFLRVTEDGRRVIDSAPPILQNTFLDRLALLSDDERLQLVHSLERVAEMMHEGDTLVSIGHQVDDTLSSDESILPSEETEPKRALGM